MIRNVPHIVAITLVFLSFTPASAQTDRNDPLSKSPTPTTLRTATEAYYGADFADALRMTDLLLDDAELGRDQRIECFLLQAFSYLARGNDQSARESIRKAWAVNRELEVDPEEVPPRFMHAYYDVMQEIEKSIVTNTLAVLMFRNNSVTQHDELDPLSQGIADMFLTQLRSNSTMQIVERERIGYIRREMQLQDSDMFDKGSAVRFGRQLGVHYLIMGSFARIGKDVRLDCRLVRTETSLVVDAESRKGKMDDLMELIDELAKSVADNLGKSKKGAEASKINYEALLFYSEGLAHLDLGEYHEAFIDFDRATKASPDYAKAERRLKQLAPLVANRAD